MSGGIPDLQADNFVADDYIFAGELYSNGVFVVGIEFVLDKTANYACFAYTCVTYQDEFE